MSNVIQLFPGTPVPQPAPTAPSEPVEVSLEVERLMAELVRMEASLDLLHVTARRMAEACKQ